MYSFVDNPTSSSTTSIPYTCITTQAYPTNIIGQYKLIILLPLRVHSYWLWPSWWHWKWPCDFHDNYFWFNCHIFMWRRLPASAIPRIFKDLPSGWKLDWRTSSMCRWVVNMQKHSSIKNMPVVVKCIYCIKLSLKTNNNYHVKQTLKV